MTLPRRRFTFETDLNRIGGPVGIAEFHSAGATE